MRVALGGSKGRVGGEGSSRDWPGWGPWDGACAAAQEKGEMEVRVEEVGHQATGGASAGTDLPG